MMRSISPPSILKQSCLETIYPRPNYRSVINFWSNILTLKIGDFTKVLSNPRSTQHLIYDSEWCKVKFPFDSSGDQFDFNTHLHVYYGRLHAPGGDSFMIWNGEKCWCWHRVDDALNFLDGLSPEEAIKVEYRPQVIEQYRQSI